MPAPYRRLGRVVKAHGTHGEVSLATSADLSNDGLADIDVWIVPPPASGAWARRITEHRPGPKGLLVRLTGVDGPAEAHELTGRWLLARGDEVPAPEASAEVLVGLTVRDAARGVIGVVRDVIVTGANDVIVVEGGRWGQVLVPVIEQVVLGVDDSGTVLEVALLDGLIDGDDA